MADVSILRMARSSANRTNNSNRKAIRHKVDHTHFIKDKEKGSQDVKKVFINQKS